MKIRRVAFLFLPGIFHSLRFDFTALQTMRIFFPSRLRPRKLIWFYTLLLFLGFMSSCSVAESRNPSTTDSTKSSSDTIRSETEPKGATIPINAEGPADTVRAFYKHLREKKFREAIFLTNLRPAIEGLTDAELKEFAVDFEAIAGQVPVEIEINGEIITGDQATVTANLPNVDGDKIEIQTIRLRRESGVWVITTADDETSKRIRRDGKNYFYNLRIETHEQEARKMLERISKAQLAHSLQNGGLFADIPSLVGAGLLPDDIRTSESTGYIYALNLAPDRKQYFATATPAVYGKSGKLSFLLQPEKGVSRVASKDTGGQPMRK